MSVICFLSENMVVCAILDSFRLQATDINLCLRTWDTMYNMYTGAFTFYLLNLFPLFTFCIVYKICILFVLNISKFSTKTFTIALSLFHVHLLKWEMVSLHLWILGCYTDCFEDGEGFPPQACRGSYQQLTQQSQSLPLISPCAEWPFLEVNC